MSPFPGGFKAEMNIPKASQTIRRLTSPQVKEDAKAFYGKAYSDNAFGAGWVPREFPGDFEDERHFGPFRWRGHLNLKDIVERAIGGSFAGIFAGGIFWLLTRMVG